MSLILEALKKSEQQRRLGEAPTLGSPILGTRRSRNMLPVIGTLIVVALGIGWWVLRTPATVTPGISSTPAAAASKPPVRTADRMRTTPAADNALVAKRNAARRAAAEQRIKATQAAMKHIDGKSRTGMPERPGSVVALPPAGALTARGLPPAKSGASTPAPPAAQPAQPANGTTMKPVPVPPPAAMTPAQAKAGAAKAGAQSALPSIWDLPYATRKELPDLQLTLHVYAPDPKQRFVVIKGERHVEGDDLGDGLILHEIRADGIVLEFKGKRFFYPRDGR